MAECGARGRWRSRSIYASDVTYELNNPRAADRLDQLNHLRLSLGFYLASELYRLQSSSDQSIIRVIFVSLFRCLGSLKGCVQAGEPRDRVEDVRYSRQETSQLILGFR
jgi:hypothetical protein